MFYYLVVIGILNLGFGYGLAAYLGYGPPSISAALRAIEAFIPPRISRPAVVALPGNVEPATVENIALVQEAPPPPEPVKNEPAQSPPPDKPISPVAMLDDHDADEVFAQPAFEVYDDDAVEVLRRDKPDAWETNSKYVETSIQNLNVAMMKSGVRAIELDRRLRACKDSPDAAIIEECLAQLKEDCQTYLTELEEATQRFNGRIGSSGKLNGLASATEMSNLGQAAQIETTLNNLEQMDFQSDLVAANHRLIEELDHLRVARHGWRDAQEAAFLSFARIENSLDTIEQQLCVDSTTGLPNRIGLEIALNSWGHDDRREQTLAAVLLDIDSLGKLNRMHGALVGDAVLYQVARRLKANVSETSLIGRNTAGSFLLVLPGEGLEAACKMAEFLREQIGQIHFQLGQETLHTTISAGVAEFRPEEPDREPMFARLAEAVKLAKQNGRNRSFFHDGVAPQPVDVPVPVVSPLEIAL
jgi:diguanylate cyclase (GGDEF)-like protein